MSVWIVSFLEEWNLRVFNTAEKAYECLCEYIKDNYDEDDNVDGILANLKAEYSNPNNFGADDIGFAERYEVE